MLQKIRVSTSIAKNGTRVPKYSSTEILGQITAPASTALNFDAVLADFSLAYKHSNLNFRHCNWVQPSTGR